MTLFCDSGLPLSYSLTQVRALTLMDIQYPQWPVPDRPETSLTLLSRGHRSRSSLCSSCLFAVVSLIQVGQNMECKPRNVASLTAL